MKVASKIKAIQIEKTIPHALRRSMLFVLMRQCKYPFVAKKARLKRLAALLATLIVDGSYEHAAGQERKKEGPGSSLGWKRVR